MGIMVYFLTMGHAGFLSINRSSKFASWEALHTSARGIICVVWLAVVCLGMCQKSLRVQEDNPASMSSRNGLGQASSTGLTL